MKKFIFLHLPRVLSILTIIFISIFTLDVFQEPNWPVSLLIHLIPSFILIIITITAWKNVFLGSILFFITAIFSIFFFSSIIIAAPTFIIGFLFLASHYLLKNN
jgi:hypothetical protein